MEGKMFTLKDVTPVDEAMGLKVGARGCVVSVVASFANGRTLYLAEFEDGNMLVSDYQMILSEEDV